MKYIILYALLVGAGNLKSQNCDCHDALKDLMDFTEENYSIISFKLTKENEAIYQAHKQTLLLKSRTAIGLDCKNLMDTYIKFFNDDHLRVSEEAFSNSEGQSSLKQSKYEEMTQLDSLQIVKLLQTDKLDPIEGIWRSDNYTVGIVRNQNAKRKRDYTGIILRSNNSNFKVGEIKMEINQYEDTYKTDYLMGNKSVKQQLVTSIIDDYNINIDDFVFWKKIFPLPAGKSGKEVWELDPRGVTFRDLGNKNYYLRIGSFQWGNIEVVEKLVLKHEALLKKANLLIVDVRDNLGGSDYTYFPLLPYIYTGPVQMTKFGAWVSPGSKAFFSEWLTKSDTLDRTPLYRAMQSDTPQLVTWPDDEMVDELDTLFKQPYKIAIIANEESASSAETFIYRCNQSDKVVTFGQNTSGTVDGFNGNDHITDCFKLRYPTCLRTVYYDTEAIDPFGILPDVFLPKDMEDVEGYIIEFMNNYHIQK